MRVWTRQFSWMLPSGMAWKVEHLHFFHHSKNGIHGLERALFTDGWKGRDSSPLWCLCARAWRAYLYCTLKRQGNSKYFAQNISKTPFINGHVCTIKIIDKWLITVRVAIEWIRCITTVVSCRHVHTQTSKGAWAPALLSVCEKCPLSRIYSDYSDLFSKLRNTGT